MWEKAVKQYSSMDNIISGEYTPEGAMKVAASRDRAREEVEQAASQYESALQTGQQPSAAPQQEGAQQAAQQAQIAANAIRQLVPATQQNDPQAIQAAIGQYIQQKGGDLNDPETQQMAQLIFQMITGG